MRCKRCNSKNLSSKHSQSIWIGYLLAFVFVYYGFHSGVVMNILITLSIGAVIFFVYKKWINKKYNCNDCEKTGLRVGLINSIFVNKISIIHLIGFCLFIFIGCQSKNGNNPSYHQGEPVILKKEYSLLPGICMYTYEGYGRKETFEDKCNKYSVGDKLGGNMPSIGNDTLNKRNK